MKLRGWHLIAAAGIVISWVGWMELVWWLGVLTVLGITPLMALWLWWLFSFGTGVALAVLAGIVVAFHFSTELGGLLVGISLAGLLFDDARWLARSVKPNGAGERK